jgi:hypothetical protein
MKKGCFRVLLVAFAFVQCCLVVSVETVWTQGIITQPKAALTSTMNLLARAEGTADIGSEQVVLRVSTGR